jgi:HK97 family phage portal protein
LSGLWSGGGSFGGWSSDRLEQARHYRQWIYIGISAIADEVARATPQVCFRVTPHLSPDAGRDSKTRAASKPYHTLRSDWHPSRANAYTRHYHAKGLGQRPQGYELEPAAPDHPLVRLLADPNGPDTGPDFYFELTLFWKLTGNAYVWAIPNGLGLPAELWVIPSHWIAPVGGEDGQIGHYRVQPFGGSGRGGLLIPAEEIIHIRDKNPLSKIDGMAPLQAGAEWIDTSEAVARSWWAHFKEGAWPGLHLSLPDDPDDETLERVYARFLDRFAGEQNMGKPIITTNGAELHRLTLTPEEMHYTQSAAELRDYVLALLRVPKGVVGLEPAGDNISAYAPLRQFCRFSISPILTRLGATFTEKLGRRFPGEPMVWYADPTPDDPAQLNADITTDFACGAIDADEIRALRGRPPRATGA